MPFMFKQTSTSLILLGILAVIVGIIAIAWPSVTVYALVILFAVYAFLGAGLQAARAFSSRTAGPVFGYLLLGLISLAAGVVAVVWPGPTALVLVLVIGAWAVVGGLVEFFNGFSQGGTAGTRAMFILTGLVSVVFGVLLFARPNVGAVTLALLFGLFSLIYGISEITPGHTAAPDRADPAADPAGRGLSRTGRGRPPAPPPAPTPRLPGRRAGLAGAPVPSGPAPARLAPLFSGGSGEQACTLIRHTLIWA
jgi:uncharacterized membrane protein HdeD (DUF308 family)